ncbi:hypothetical protein THAOC_06182 [Thalassiosira oceanica]|uniref:Uncharacterized protein n=1 Tax=Thalassiosira oceanica TaxID=159749 RepID=K0TLZ9_THAOC|nr:hypothetical protein THAOC_06182 [Thalassiosira oceanica]|eukprot:EJK72297.1 hypothetical protein THAOC_06182 [Thalassiosira oceanica]
MSHYAPLHSSERATITHRLHAAWVGQRMLACRHWHGQRAYPYVPPTAEISAVRGLTAEITAVRVEHESDASVAHPPAGISQPIQHWAYCGGSASLVRSGSVQRSRNKARPRRSEARRACSASGTLKHDAARFPPPSSPIRT